MSTARAGLHTMPVVDRLRNRRDPLPVDLGVEACDDRHRLQKEIARCRFDDPGQLNLEVGKPVAVNIAADDLDVVGSTGLVERLVVKLSGPAVKILRPDEPEVLVALSGRVRVDGREIDLVLAGLEVGDDVAQAGPDRTLAHRS